MKLKWLGAVAFSLVAIAQAQAAIVNVSYFGTVVSGNDQTGIFGIVDTTGVAYAGYSYEATFVFDTTRGNTVSTAFNNGADGGSETGNASPALSASVTINDVTRSIDPSYFGQIEGFNLIDFSQQFHSAENRDGIDHDESSRASVSVQDGILPASITGPLTYNVGDPTPFIHTYAFYDLSGNGDDTHIFASVNTLIVSSAVPEPSTWAMLLLGFAGIGFMSYRRFHSANPSYRAQPAKIRSCPTTLSITIRPQTLVHRVDNVPSAWRQY